MPVPASVSNSYSRTCLNVILAFTATNGFSGTELWKSDGTALGMAMVTDLNSSSGSTPLWLTVFDNHVYFTADDNIHGRELWKSDLGNNTVLVKDIYPSGSSDPSFLAQVGPHLFFAANEPTAGN